MGVSWVFETKESARAVELAFERAGAVLIGTPKSFKLDGTWYRPTMANQISSFYVIHHSNFPESSFVIGWQEHTSRLLSKGTSDKGFDLILSKLGAGLLPELNTRFEITGNEYELKDFRLRVGTVSIGTTVKGVVVEFEYEASSIVYQCHAILTEIVELFFPGQSTRVQKPDVLTRTTFPDNYAPIDTIVQYLDVYMAMRKRA